ncbi:MAG: sigma-70 family RNA polymerase sigma factor, partial [Blastocatellia bacterium]
MTVSMTTADPWLENAFQSHQRFLWSLCYRMTGNAADADDLVQETFIRAISHLPRREWQTRDDASTMPMENAVRPWLVRVAVNLCRDLLRQRRRRKYDGPWLPAPIETDAETLPSYEPPAGADSNPAARYDMLESVSFAFLLALESLTPTQRAVLLLRDVFDYSISETATALGISEANTKTTHHRARRAIDAYDRHRRPPTSSLQEQTRRMMERFLGCLYNHDVAGAAALLASDVRHISDGGGEYIAARVPVCGPDKVARFSAHLLKNLAPDARVRTQY